MTNTLILSYLFLGGTGAGAVFLLILLDLLSPSAASASPERRMPGLPYSPQPMYRRFFLPGFLVGGGTLVLGVLCLVFDLGRIDRLLLLFTNPNLSYVAVGTYALVLLLGCTVIYAAVWSGLWRRIPRLLIRVVGVLGLVAAFTVMLYTGLLFWSMGTGLILGSVLLPVLFVLSSLSCGTALLLALFAITETRRHFDKAVKHLAIFDIGLVVIELICLLVLILLSLDSPTPYATVIALIWGDYALVFWTGVVACGLLIPLLVEGIDIFVRSQTAEQYTLAVVCLLLVGGYCLRWSLLGAGLPAFITAGL